jgi:hypothetical protein
MALSCPNPNSVEWQRLVHKHGLDGAIKEFVKNNYEVPSIEKFSPNTKIYNGIERFNKQAVMQHLNENPKAAAKIIKKVRELYPSVKISKDGFIDESGKYIAIPPGKRGMHRRGAIISAIAYANDATMDTIPHEFAHEYIQMYVNHPVVQQALRQYGEEQLATEMGKYFARKETQSWFQNFLEELKYLIRKTFGDPTISEMLSRNFHKGVEMGEKAIGQDYISFQSKQNGSTFIKGTARLGDQFSKTSLDNSFMSAEDIKNWYGGFGGIIDGMTDAEGNVDLNELHRLLKLHYDVVMQYKAKAREGKLKEQTDMNMVELDSKRITDFRNFIETDRLTPNLSNLKLLAEYLKGDVELNPQNVNFEKNVNTLMSIHQQIGFYDSLSDNVRQGYQQTIENKIFLEGNEVADLDEVSNAAITEIKEHLKTKDQFFKALSNKIPDSLKFVKDLATDKYMPWLYDGYLLAKAITGTTDGVINKLFYDSLNNGTRNFKRIQNQFQDLFTVEGQNERFKNWGSYDNRKGTIEDFETYDITTLTGEKVKLTKSEATTLFLMLSQNDTYNAIEKNGFYIDELLGRNMSVNKAIKLSPESRSEIIKDFTTNKDYMEAVNAVRRVMDMLYEETTQTYKLLNGENLPQKENYYPAYYGKKTIEERTRKNVLEQFRSAHARYGADMPVRIGDFKRITNNHATASAMYASNTLPIRNVRNVLRKIRYEFEGTSMERKLDHMEGFLKNLEDPTMLYSSQGERKATQNMNRIMSNFSIYALGYNPFVVVKQTASYQAVASFIPKKHLASAGYKIGPLLVPDLAPFFKSLKTVNSEGELYIARKELPLKYRLTEENPTYAEILKYSPVLKNRATGHIDRETSEALMDRTQGTDKIYLKVPFKKKKVAISKTRAMEGIRVMDTVTIMGIWEAMKSYTNERIANGELNLEVGSEAYFEHVTFEAENVINRTQPSSDIINRSALSTSKNPVIKGVTMFSSATQKIGQLMIESTMDFKNNPTAENRQKMMFTFGNAVLTTAIYVTVIDMIRAMMYGYMDDEEDYLDFATYNVINNMGGYFHVFGNLVRGITSRIDNQPWQSTTQHPLEVLFDDTTDVFANLLQGKFGKSFEKTLDVIFKTKGIPITPIKAPKNIFDNILKSDPLTAEELKLIPEYNQDVKVIDKRYKQIEKEIANEYQKGSPEYDEAIKEVRSEKRKEKKDIREGYQ